MTDTVARDTLAVLARQEVRRYLRHPLFWAGVVLTAAVAVVSLVDPDPRGSSAGDGLAPAATIGLFGLVVMAGMVRGSDRAAAAAGAVAVPERTRTLALAAAVVVPFAAGLTWFAAAAIALVVHPPGPSGPFGASATWPFLLAGLATEGLVPCVGGPLLGLVVGRWVRWRGATPLVVVVVVLVTVVMQGGLVVATTAWRQVWWWTHFQGAIGTLSDSDRWVLLPGSPSWFAAYQVTWCAVGVLVAVYHDPESDRSRLLRALLALGVVAVACCVLSLSGGADGIVISDVPSSGQPGSPAP